jgi:hypothetical protein
MAIILSLSYTERNDNKAITLTDTSTGWATPAGLGITTLTLGISITTSDNTTTVYTPINLVVHNSIGVGTTYDQLVYVLDAADFVSGGIPLGTNNTVLPDGIYRFTYTLNADPVAVVPLDEYVLMEGNVRNAVYEALRTLPTLYTCTECKHKTIMDAIFAYGYLNSIRAGGYVAKTEELISQLYTLERLLEYGSSYTW